MRVVDASAVVDALFGGERSDGLAERLAGSVELAAPHLIDLETLSAFRRIVRGGFASADRITDARRDLAKLPILRYPHEPFADRIWELRDALTAYDAAYVALAEALAVPLVTCDAKLAAAAGDQCPIELFG
jgi:predicted nucleic acid-binding protein